MVSIVVNHLEIISYQILLKHQVFIICVMILFQIVLLCLPFRSREDHVTEMREIINDFLS